MKRRIAAVGLTAVLVLGVTPAYGATTYMAGYQRCSTATGHAAVSGKQDSNHTVMTLTVGSQKDTSTMRSATLVDWKAWSANWSVNSLKLTSAYGFCHPDF